MKILRSKIVHLKNLL